MTVFERFTDRARRVVTRPRTSPAPWVTATSAPSTSSSPSRGTRAGWRPGSWPTPGVSADDVRADVLEIVGKGPVGAVDLLGPADADALRAIGIDVDSIRQRIEESFGPGALELASRPRRRGRRLPLRRPRRPG